MKIGLLTFHREINAGANLQAYALKTFLTRNHFDVEIIDFVPNSGVDKRSWKRKIFHLAKVILLSSARKETLKKNKYRSFQKKHYYLSDKKYFGDLDIRNNIGSYDVIISGSDQILNLSLSDYSFTYYIPFDNVKKISYASSFGRTDISDIEKWAILNYLPEFSNLSFREESAYEIVNQIIGLKKKNVVVDPVFLLSKEEWNQIINKKAKTKQKYILIYAMEYSEWMEKTINTVVSNNREHKVIIIYGSNCKFNIQGKHKNIQVFDPSDFISLFYYSDIVITNSFHGLSFSMIFQKKVFCCAHSTRNTRLENLLKLAESGDKIITANMLIFDYIDGIRAYEKITKAITESKDYLLSALEAIND